MSTNDVYCSYCKDKIVNPPAVVTITKGNSIKCKKCYDAVKKNLDDGSMELCSKCLEPVVMDIQDYYCEECSAMFCQNCFFTYCKPRDDEDELDDVAFCEECRK